MAPVDDTGDRWPEPQEPARPPPWRSPLRRGWDASAGRLRPWIAWFGAGRIAGGALTIIATVLGGWWLLRPPVAPTEAVLPYASAPARAAAGPPGGPASSTTSAPMPAAGTVTVHVAGAVAGPGVYELPAGTRVVDGLAAAGGGTPDADLGALNLAAVLADGQRVYVPHAGEVPPGAAVSADVGSPAAGAAVSGPLDLNAATAAELDSLPGIGPATAAAIVAHRDEHGPFPSVDALEAVRGIGPAKLDAVRDLVTT